MADLELQEAAATEVANLLGRVEHRVDVIETIFRAFQRESDPAQLARIAESMIGDLEERARYLGINFTDRGPHKGRIIRLKQRIDELLQEMRALRSPVESTGHDRQLRQEKIEPKTTVSQTQDLLEKTKAAFPIAGPHIDLGVELLLMAEGLRAFCRWRRRIR